MGFFDSRKTTVTQEPLLTEEQKRAQKGLSKFVDSNIGKFDPGKDFGRDFNIGATGLEKTGLAQLQKFLGAPNTGEAFAAGKNQILDTLGGKFLDPKTNPLISSLTNLSKRSLNDAIDASRASSGARGKFFSSSAIEEEGKITEGSLANLQAVIGGLLNTERGRQFDAAGQAQQFDQFENLTAPLSKIGASQSFGNLERIIEQGNLEAQYQDFLRKQSEEGGVVNTAQNLFSTNVPFGVKSVTKKQPSIFQSLLGEVSPIVGSYNTQKYGQGASSNQAGLNDAMKQILKIISAGQA